MPEPPDLSALTGCVVGRVSLDYQVSLLLASTDGIHGERVDALLVIESPFTITRGGRQLHVEPNAKRGLEATLGLLHRAITAASISADESLSLTLDGEQEIHVPRDPNYEAWQISGRGIQGWIAGPM